ncbi:Magnesium transporter 2 isoform 2 [Quillaja saponaria]|uniref:Magnesium transporter 2 isoform 2 n=1 Tax=Quillaja saponaria TaxID=32244 RepID=A0AAD7LSW0_QUISA|nr:Magnesium transporter 2 isoform 2 [Quillaja saponaria]
MWWDAGSAHLGRVCCGSNLARPFQAQSGLTLPERRLWVTWLLKWRAKREAGFTEQRKPPSPSSGRITSWCHSDLKVAWLIEPIKPSHFFLFTFLLSFQSEILDKTEIGAYVTKYIFVSFPCYHTIHPLTRD